MKLSERSKQKQKKALKRNKVDEQLEILKAELNQHNPDSQKNFGFEIKIESSLSTEVELIQESAIEK